MSRPHSHPALGLFVGCQGEGSPDTAVRPLPLAVTSAGPPTSPLPSVLHKGTLSFIGRRSKLHPSCLAAFPRSRSHLFFPSTPPLPGWVWVWDRCTLSIRRALLALAGMGVWRVESWNCGTQVNVDFGEAALDLAGVTLASGLALAMDT